MDVKHMECQPSTHLYTKTWLGNPATAQRPAQVDRRSVPLGPVTLLNVCMLNHWLEWYK